MDRKAFNDRRRIGTVKTAVSMYGERILEGSSSMKKTQMDLPEESSSRARELHMAKTNISRHKKGKRAAESAKAQAESELSKAKMTVKDLALQIETSNLKVTEQIHKMEQLKMSSEHEDKTLAVSADCPQYVEVMRQLEYVKQELSKLKLDKASVVEEKMLAQKEFKHSNSKLQSSLSSAEALREEIEHLNEEQVLVELATIEALKEFGEIEARRKKETNGFSIATEENRKKLNDAVEEIERSKELEFKLNSTLYDVKVLQNELKLAKEMERKVQRNDSMQHSGGSFRRSQELEGSPSLRKIMKELVAAKKELASIREEGFQFMSSMDIIRNELKHVTEETARVKKAEEKADLTVQNLNSKLLRAKSKLEAVTKAEEKAKSIVSNLSLTLEQLKTEAEVANKEKELISEETANIKTEIQKTESEIYLTEEQLMAAIQELEAVKASEALALEKLQNTIEDTIRTRASASKHSSYITISKFEYEYLTGRAGGAEEIADKKVAAAQAWIEALKTSEKEILMKIDMARREIKETRVEEEQEVYRTERSLSAKKLVEGEIRNWKQKCEKNAETEKQQMALLRKSNRRNNNMTQLRSAKIRNSASPGVRMSTPRSTSITIRKKKKVMPNLVKFFAAKRIVKGV